MLGSTALTREFIDAVCAFTINTDGNAATGNGAISAGIAKPNTEWEKHAA